MDVTIQLSPKDYSESRRLYRLYDPAYFRNTRRLVILSAAMILASVGGIILNNDAWPWFILALLVSAGLLADPYLRRRRGLKQLTTSTPVKLRISRPDEGEQLICESEYAISAMKWEPYAGWLEGEHIFILIVGKDYHVFPKRCFNEDDLNEFREVLRRRLPLASPIS